MTRRSQRIQVDPMYCKAVVDFASLGVPYEMMLSDVSPDGFRIFSNRIEKVSTGDILKVQLRFENRKGQWEIVDLQGVIVWHEKELNAAGGRFLELDAEKSEKILNFIMHQRKIFGSKCA
jgi:hypothetical protein